MANYNPNLVKVNRNYTFSELAEVFGVHKNTVSAWVKSGMPCLKGMRPYLILGAEARHYLKAQRTGRKQKCKPHEMFCMRCKTPTQLAERFAVYTPISATKGRLSGFCIRCECLVNKFISRESLTRYSQYYDLEVSGELEHINDSYNPL
mgnify:FL=1